MAPPKRKQPHDAEDELLPRTAQRGKTRRGTRQTPILPPPLPVPPKTAPLPQRPLRGNSSVVVDAKGNVDVKLRGQGRTRRSAAAQDTAAVANEQEPTKPKRTTRTSAANSESSDKAKADQKRKLRSGPVARGRVQTTGAPAATKRATRRAARTPEIADSDASDEAEEGSDMDGESGASSSESGSKEEAEDDGNQTTTKRGARRAATPPARRSKRAAVTGPTTITPVSPPQVPAPTQQAAVDPAPSTAAGPPTVPASTARKETTIKPPVPPVSPVPGAATARPKKVTDIKPPAASSASRFMRATPIQPPSMLPAQEPKHKLPRQQQQQQDQAPLEKPRRVGRPPKITPIETPQIGLRSAPAAAATGSGSGAGSGSGLASLTTAPPPPSPGRPDRNIDMVVLGEICFRAWYPSYYGKEVLGDTTGNAHHGRGSHAHHQKGTGKENHPHQHRGHTSQHPHSHMQSHHHHHHHRDHPPMLDRLYVCPFCFKYSKEIVPWHGHVQICETQFQIPGEKVYVHPKGTRTVRVPVAAPQKAKRKRASGETDIQYVEQIERDEGEWSIWEVDGEKDGLFCQNLSLFAKLFLDNKSVFFDVTGFYYFLLVYTPPVSSASASLRAANTPTAASAAAAAAAGSTTDKAVGGGAVPRPRVVGFFSKEKMSWDNNNLACILVFPPWQRKGLGALLMGISYEISRREGVLGGPEKPISDLGKKSYKRFWAGEIARWLLSVDLSSASASSLPTSSSDGKSAAAAGGANDGVVIDVADCSRATWIVREDCLLVLRDMGIVEDAGLGPPKRYCANALVVQDEHGAAAGAIGGSGSGSGEGRGTTPIPSSSVSMAEAATGVAATGQSASTTASGAGPSVAATAATAGDKTMDAPKDVQRVRLSKAAIRQWVKEHGISLEKVCDPAGFIKNYAKTDDQPAAGEV
ncbi:histone acetyltransferase [Niveomyces insectorum RCEF 264]|uniref:Histone acetyltransferase n=1 Tax=Niveomyces insectorum RCEF 264 TaxID=1081102 RepID=A0A167X9Z1_9HYPO|nr:histone acetyltransferase [Niveomyces insectorum RCEF 264]